MAAREAERDALRGEIDAAGALRSRLAARSRGVQTAIDGIEATEARAVERQGRDRAILAAAAAQGIESAKATVIRTLLENTVSDPSKANPGTPRFAKDGALADLVDSEGNQLDRVFARNPNAAPDATPPALYADYGMWLDGTDAVPSLETRMGLVDSGGAAGTVDLTTAGTTDNGLAATATYTGVTRGLSARATGTGDAATTASGHFEADVRLEATFGPGPTLGGEIRDFRSADPAAQGTAHVGSWTVDLGTAVLGSGDVPNASFGGVGTGHPTAGGWSAYAYGTDGARPAGFYGGFDADFADGAAIGQFDATAE